MKSEQDLIQAFESVVLYKVDAEKGEGKDLAKEFNVRGYPTFALLTSDGNPIDRWMGYSKSFFINTLAEATKDLGTIDTKMARFNSSPSEKDAVALGRYNSSIGKYKEAVSFYREAQNRRTEASKDYAAAIFENTSDGYDKIFNFDEVRLAADDALSSKDLEPRNAYYISRQMAELVMRVDRKDLLPKYIETGLNATRDPNEPSMANSYKEMQIMQALHITGEGDKAVELKKSLMPEGWQNDAGQLNNFAWWCFENKINLAEAEKLSRKSVEIAEPGKSKAMNLDTLAEIKFALGKVKEAAEHENLAIAEDPENQFYKDQLNRFKETGAGK